MACSLSLPRQPTLSQRLHKQRHQLRPRLHRERKFTKCIMRNVPTEIPLSRPTVSCRLMRPTQQKITSLASMWREIQGSNDWCDLITPLNPQLRDEVIRYGELVNACYKAFDLDPSSKLYLNCKHGKANMLREVGMSSSGYEIIKYVYAAPGISMPTRQADAGRSRWIGYVAVSTDEHTERIGRRDILVSFRGTVTCTEWLANLMSSLTPPRFDPNNEHLDVMVESGFLSLYTSNDEHTCKFGQGSCREQLLKEVSSLINKHKGGDLSVTLAGHSMGSSLAVLFGYDLTELGLNRLSPSNEVPVTVYSFGGPRVGNSRFRERCNELGLKVLRVVNSCDPIAKLPGVILNEGTRVVGGKYEHPWSNLCYVHVGAELPLNLFNLENPKCVHDMETYLGLLKCTMKEKVKKKGGLGFYEKAKEMLQKQRSIGFWPLQDAARQVGDCAISWILIIFLKLLILDDFFCRGLVIDLTD